MMTTTKLYARTCALPAIAAVLALSSTQALAQEVQPAQPVTTEPAPTTTVQPAPAPDELAPTTDSSVAAPVSDTPTKKTTSTTTRQVTRTVRTTAAKPAAVTTHTATRTVATHASVPAAAPPPTQKAEAAPPPAPQPPAAPVVNLSSKASPPTSTAAPEPIKTSDETLEIAAGGAFVLLALGGTAAAVARRRRRKEQEWADEQTMAYEPFETAAAPEPASLVHEEQPAVAAPSAFAWGPVRAPETTAANGAMAEKDDRRPGETWVERAYRGPTPNNPSVSLRHRLKRAAFFDKREREAAAGLAEPVDASAGLPGSMVEEQRELA